MGVDITMHIIDTKGNMLAENIFGGRNSEWFNNLRSRGCNRAYESIPTNYGLPSVIPASVQKDYLDADGNYYDFNYITVSEFKRWFKETKPHLEAGWVNTYDKWQYETRGLPPQEVHFSLDTDMNPYDYHFIEFEDLGDCSKWLYDFCNKRKYNNGIIVFYFDC